MNRKILVLPFKKRRIGMTDYKKRLQLLKSGKPRLAVRKSLRSISAQVISYSPDGDKVVIGANASELKSHGWSASTGNVPAAYLTGYLLAMKAKKSKIVGCTPDIGFHSSVKGSRIYACIKGVVDGGLIVPIGESMPPDQSRLRGEHISSYNSSLTDDARGVRFKKHTGENIPEMFDKVKASIGNSNGEN